MGKKVFNGSFGFKTPELTDTLRKIEADHKIPPVDLARGLLEAACKFYHTHGWFSFPVVIQPEAFHLRMVAEEQAAYESMKAEEKKKKK